MGEERLAPDVGDNEAILQQAMRAFPQLQQARVVATRVGLRRRRRRLAHQLIAAS